MWRDFNERRDQKSVRRGDRARNGSDDDAAPSATVSDVSGERRRGDAILRVAVRRWGSDHYQALWRGRRWARRLRADGELFDRQAAGEVHRQSDQTRLRLHAV